MRGRARSASLRDAVVDDVRAPPARVLERLAVLRLLREDRRRPLLRSCAAWRNRSGAPEGPGPTNSTSTGLAVVISESERAAPGVRPLLRLARKP